MKPAERLYAILDPRSLRIEVALVGALLQEAGVPWVQLRDKAGLDDGRYERARRLRAALSQAEVTMWCNDRVDLALLVGADAVHLGQDDLAPETARPLIPGKLIGWSTHTDRQVAAAQANAHVDVVAIGPIFATSSKPGHEKPVGLAGLRRARALTTKPLVAIGGLTPTTIGAVLAAGADRVAILGGLGSGSLGDIERRLAGIIAAIAAGRSFDGR